MFKQCNTCKKIWNSRDEFLNDPDISLIGYQVHFKSLEKGLFLFNHNGECRTTLAIEAINFFDMFSGERYDECRAKLPGCPGYCLQVRNLDRCDQFCECAFIREILYIINSQYAKFSCPVENR